MMSADDRSISELLASLCDETISPEEMERLDRLICTDAAVRRQYIEYLDLHARLSCQFHQSAEPIFPFPSEGVESELPGRLSAVDDLRSTIGDSPAGVPFPPIVIQTGPDLTSPFSGFYLSSGSFVFSYLVAAVIVGVGLLIGWTYQVTASRQAVSVASRPGAATQLEPDTAFVGRVSDMVDCRWADPSTEPFHGARVPLGRMYALSAGLMEITYDSGAKVILQGPCTYQVESKSSGYLSIGRLTARVEKRGEGGGKREENLANRQFVNGNPRHSPPLSPLLSPLFSVRTPTAVVTDLGTEFGVEVALRKATRVCVLEGRVALRSSAETTRVTTLEKGQSSFVDTLGTVARQSEAEAATLAKTFIRSMPRRKDPGFVSLADLVAGGNGFGSRSEWGINPLNAVPVPGALQRTFLDSSGGRYQRYGGLRQIDGVFIPNGGDGPVQLDSAGHAFALPKTRGQTFGLIWASKCEGLGLAPDAGEPIQKLTASHPVIMLHANAGITFNLSAIRASVPNCNATRFQATIYNDSRNNSTPTLADAWVFVDGQLRFSRAKLRRQDGLVEVDVPLGPNDRFLTLVSTDGGDGITSDVILYHNPRILLETVSKQRVASELFMIERQLFSEAALGVLE